MATDWKRVHRIVRRVWLTAAITFTAWLIWNARAHGVPDTAFQSSLRVTVQEGDGATLFVPVSASPDVPLLVFLPGGAVDPDAYVPFVRAIADAGWPVALVRLPWRMAFSDDAQAEVWRRITGVDDQDSRSLVIGGHSRGAALSAGFAGRHRDVVDGLFLIGTTHPRDENLSNLTMPVLKISGTNDCVASERDSRANAARLPGHTVWHSIAGANHAQFGHYGMQLGDCGAAISRENQQNEALGVLRAWLVSLGGA